MSAPTPCIFKVYRLNFDTVDLVEDQGQEGISPSAAMTAMCPDAAQWLNRLADIHAKAIEGQQVDIPVPYRIVPAVRGHGCFLVKTRSGAKVTEWPEGCRGVAIAARKRSLH